MKKNVASQVWTVFAFDKTNSNAKTGDAANITAKIKKDATALAATNDVNPTELEDGLYQFDLTQAETNADKLLLSPESSTANIQVIGMPGTYDTVPEFFSVLGIESDGDLTKVNTLNGHTAQTGDSFARIGAGGASLGDLGGMSTGMKDEVNAEVDVALNTAIPGGPTTDSMNQRVKAIDDLTQVGGAGDLVNVLGDTNDMQPKIGTPVSTLAGDLASNLTAIQAVQNNTRFSSSPPTPVIIPETGDLIFKISCGLFDTAGNPEDPDVQDGAVQIAIIGRAINGAANKLSFFNDEAGTVGATTSPTYTPSVKMVNTSVGRYEIFYKLPSSESIDNWNFTFNYAEASVEFIRERGIMIVEENPDLVTIANTDTNKKVIVDAIRENIPGSTSPAEASSVQAELVVEIDENETLINALNDLSKLDVATALLDQNIFTTLRTGIVDGSYFDIIFPVIADAFDEANGSTSQVYTATSGNGSFAEGQEFVVLFTDLESGSSNTQRDGSEWLGSFIINQQIDNGKKVWQIIGGYRMKTDASPAIVTASKFGVFANAADADIFKITGGNWTGSIDALGEEDRSEAGWSFIVKQSLTTGGADPTFPDSGDDLQIRSIAGGFGSDAKGILADTNELQIDWANGGRLDLIIDAIRAKTDNLPEGIKKNTASTDFPFMLVLSSDGKSPATSVSVTATRSIDGGNFTAMTNSVVEKANGLYHIDLSAADTNGNFITYRFTGATALDRLVSFKTVT